MMSKERCPGLALAAFLAAVLLASPPLRPEESRADRPRLPALGVPQAAVLPTPGEIEQDLLNVLNAEREARGLPALRPSPRLADLARTQSTEMARRGVLAHESAAGRSFTDRLFDAGVTFAANGENVARSGTYLARLIHESFMGSPGHRENVLNPLFDEVGIGVAAGDGNSYYVTEDFVRALVEKPAAEVRAFIRGVLDEARTAAARPPVVLLEEADRAAQTIAGEKAAGRPVPPVPDFFGETLVRVATGPDLEMIAGRIRGRELAGYGRAGIGVVFGRGPEYPGGAYCVCVLLIKDGAGTGPDDLDRVLAVLKAVNEVRARKKLAPLDLDAGLSGQADAVIASRRAGRADGSSLPAQGTYYFSMFVKLQQIGEPLRKGLEDPAVRRVGISVLPVQTEDNVSLKYAVAVVLGR